MSDGWNTKFAFFNAGKKWKHQLCQLEFRVVNISIIQDTGRRDSFDFTTTIKSKASLFYEAEDWSIIFGPTVLKKISWWRLVIVFYFPSRGLNEFYLTSKFWLDHACDLCLDFDAHLKNPPQSLVKSHITSIGLITVL